MIILLTSIHINLFRTGLYRFYRPALISVLSKALISVLSVYYIYIYIYHMIIQVGLQMLCWNFKLASILMKCFWVFFLRFLVFWKHFEMRSRRKMHSSITQLTALPDQESSGTEFTKQPRIKYMFYYSQPWTNLQNLWKLFQSTFIYLDDHCWILFE